MSLSYNKKKKLAFFTLKLPTRDTTFRNSICFVADDSLDAVDIFGPNFVLRGLWLVPRFDEFEELP